MSKGSKPRPVAPPPEEYERRWENTFGPRSLGPHGRVYDHLRKGNRAWVECHDCGAGWPEGGFYPETCK